MCVQPFLQETLENHQEGLKRQREAVKYRLKKLAARQSEITVSAHSSVLKSYHNMESSCHLCYPATKNTDTMITPVVRQHNKLTNAYP